MLKDHLLSVPYYNKLTGKMVYESQNDATSSEDPYAIDEKYIKSVFGAR